MNVQCINCCSFGYFRTEHARGGGTIYFHPETLPEAARRSIFSGSGLAEHLQKLLAQDCGVRCLREKIDPSGRPISFEPRLDSVNAQTHETAIRDIALLVRDCPAFLQFDPGISFSDRKSLDVKRQTDAAADLVMRRRRQASHLALLGELEALAANSAVSPQCRGKEFEGWFGGLFTASQLRYTLDVRNEREQIDLTLWIGSLFAIGEVRWLKDSVDVPQMRDFFGKLIDRPPFVVGIFFSVNGYTEPARKWAESNTNTRTILMFDLEHLRAILAGDRAFGDAVFEMLNARLNRPSA